MDDRAAINEELFSDEVCRELTKNALVRFATAAKCGRLAEEQDLVEVIATCIFNSLKLELQEQGLEQMKWTQ